MEKLDEDEIEFMAELGDSMVNIYTFTDEEKKLADKLEKLGYIKAEKAMGFKNYFFRLTEKAIKEFKIKLG
jgi:flavodoxin